MPKARSIMKANAVASVCLFIPATAVGLAMWSQASPPAYAVFAMFVALASVTSFKLCSDALRVLKCEDSLFIGEEGIRLHWRHQSQVSAGEHNFVLFGDIEAIFPNINSNLPYVSLVLKDGRVLEIDKDYVTNLLGFLDSISDRAMIVTERDVLLRPKERWYVRCRSHK
ncbi:MAG: hypothetical protein ACE5KV_04840 [Thermoplasmata archaeon]